MIDKKPSVEIIDTIVCHLQEGEWYLHSIDENLDDREILIIFTDELDNRSIPCTKLTGSIVILDKVFNEDWMISCCRRENLNEFLHYIDIPINTMRWFVELTDAIDKITEFDYIEYLKGLKLE